MNWYKKICLASQEDNASTAEDPQWHQADSEAIDRYRYDSVNRRFWIRFHNGRVYYYSDVPPTTYENFLKAKSKGRFVIDNIIKRFEATRV